MSQDQAYLDVWKERYRKKHRSMEDWFIMIEPLWLKPSKLVIATIAFWGQMTIYKLYIITFIIKEQQ